MAQTPSYHRHPAILHHLVSYPWRTPLAIELSARLSYRCPTINIDPKCYLTLIQVLHTCTRYSLPETHLLCRYRLTILQKV